MSDQTYTISKLAEAGQVTVRTIRYYVAEALLPPPAGGGRAATYSQEHLDRLKLIKILKAEFLPLQEIATLLTGLDHQAVVELLAEKQQSEPPPSPAPDSAKEYLQTLLNPAAAPDQSGTLMRHKVGDRPANRRPLSRSSDTDVPGVLRKSAPAPEQPAFRANSRGGDATAETPAELQQSAEVTRWQRVPITPDVELHIREGAVQGTLGQKIERLVKIARQILSVFI